MGRRRVKQAMFIGVILSLATPTAAVARPAQKKQRVRLFSTQLTIKDGGIIRQDAGSVQTDGRTTKDHRFRIKLERGHRKCPKGGPRVKVDRIVAILGGMVVAELKASDSCWQQTQVFLPHGKEPQGKRLVIQGYGKRGGVVRAWLDAYPRVKQEAAAAPFIPVVTPGREVPLLSRTRITIGAMGKVTKKIGPFPILGLDTTKNDYLVVTRIPAAYGKECDASKTLRPHTVKTIKTWINDKLAGLTVTLNECGMTYKGGSNLKLKPRGNLLKVEATGKPGAQFEIGFILVTK